MLRLERLLPGILFVVLLLLNVDGHPKYLWSPWGGWLTAFDGGASSNFYRYDTGINFLHGWPCAYMVRVSGYSIKAGRGVPVTVIRGANDRGDYSRWPFDGAPIDPFSIWALAINVIFALALILSVSLSCRKLSGRFAQSWQFGMKLLLAITAVVAIACRIEVWQYLSASTVYYAAFAYISCCINFVLVVGSIAAFQEMRRIRQPR